LMALYEHRTAVQGFVWGLNSFDNFAADSGVQNMRHIRAQLSASRKTGASVQGFNTGTSALLDHYLRYGK
jgi:glucose-6-phosphate isomerase